MKLSRDTTLKIQFLLDECLPPLLRNSRWFMWLPFKLLFGKNASMFLDFKPRAPFMDNGELKALYQELSTSHIDRDTDINSACLTAITGGISGETVLDAGCGEGFLSRKLSENYQVTGVDISIPASPQPPGKPRVDYFEAALEALPFADAAFDTVVSAHTLEHVLDPRAAVAELRRVARERLIIIVPRQRPYRYTFDLHLSFFPERYDLLRLLDPRPERYRCECLGGDWFYVEDL